MVDAARLDALLVRARLEVDEDVVPSCQVAVGFDGEVIAFEAFGDARLDTRYNVFSCTKPMVASAAWVLMGEGSLDITRPVADYLSGFGAHAKQAVTVEQVLLHTAGVPHATLLPPAWDTSRTRLDAFASWELSHEAGAAFEYHPTSAHWVLAEIVAAVAGTDFWDFFHQRVTAPAGLPGRLLGVPPDEQDDIAVLVATGEPATADELEAAIGVRELPTTEVTEENLLAFNRADVRAVGIPGAGGIMRAADLVRFGQALLHDRSEIWHPDVLADAVGHVRNRLPDPLFHMAANRTLGLVQAGDDGLAFLRGFGSATSAAAVGHGGAGGQVSWADPATGLSFAYVTNGIDANIIRQFRRGMTLSTMAAGLLT
ncbi:MAG: serine hydrolase domain-containing protein [Acidimicrobiales bacterium]